MRRISRGFTIIEVLIVVAVIGILATISIVGFNRYQADTRDAQRSSKATIIAEALEKYYDQNGEYPSCPAITDESAVNVTTTVLPGLEQNTLVTPTETVETNSIECQELTVPSDGDYFAYVGGDNSAECLSGSACALFTLKYIDESSGSIKSIQGRRKVTVSGAPLMNCSAVSFTEAHCDWSPVDGAVTYDLQYTTDSEFMTDIVTIESIVDAQYDASGLDYCTQYHFRARAIGVSGAGSWSSSVPLTTLCLTPPSISATVNSVSQITISWGVVENATTYTVQGDNDSDFSSPTTYTSIAGTSQVFTSLQPGTTYHFKARSENLPDTSPYSSSIDATTPNPVLSPASSCSGTYSGRPDYNIILYYAETSYDLEANTSNVYWSAFRYPNKNKSAGNGTYSTAYIGGWGFNAQLNGTVVVSGSSRSKRWYPNNDVNTADKETFDGPTSGVDSYYSGTITIAHNADGAKTIATYAYDGSTSIFGTASCSSSYVLSDLR